MPRLVFARLATSFVKRKPLTLIGLALCVLCPLSINAQIRTRIDKPFQIGGTTFSPEELVQRGPDGKAIPNPIKVAALQEAILAYYAEDLGIAPTSKFYNRLKSVMSGNGPLVFSSQADNTHPETVLVHLRSTDGVVLPTEEDLMAHPLISEDQIHEQVEHYVNNISENQAEPRELTASELKPCDFGKTVDFRPERTADGGSPPEFDFLFVAPGDDSIENQNSFGEQVVVMVYRPGAFSPEAFTAKEMGVSCLPTRIRYKQGIMYLHEGREALLNYDRDPKGKPVKIVKNSLMPN